MRPLPTIGHLKMLQRDYTPRAMVDRLDQANADFIRRTLADYLRAGAGLKVKDPRVHELRHSSLDNLAAELSPHHRSVNSSDFAAAMADSLSVILADEWPDYSQRLDPFCRAQELENFQPHPVHEVTFPELSDDSVPEDAPVDFSPITITNSATAQLKTYETRIKVSRQLWSTHGESLVRATLRQAHSFYLLELRLLSELLVSNPSLSDADNLFNTSNSTASALSAGTLDSAMAWLTSGSPSALTASGLLCGPGKEFSARTLLATAGVNWPVLSSPWLPNNSYYVFSNPVEHASILRLRERGSSQHPRVGWANIHNSQAKGYYAWLDCGFSAVSRAGIYRGGI